MNKLVSSALCVALLLCVAATPAAAQGNGQDSGEAPIADVSGPGQPVAQPPAQCPRTIACQYAEENLLSSGYRLQSVRVCGADCTSQYWVALMSNGQELLEIDPLRAGAILAVASGASGTPPVRVVMPMYGPTDPACCPSGFSDTTYTWDAGSSTLVPGQPVLTPADQFPGYDATRQELSAEGWVLGNV